MKQTYLIEYSVYNSSGNVIKDHKKMRIKNKASELAAKIGLEKYLERKIEGFSHMVIHKCEVENPFQSMFGDIPDNPFGF
jgi:hypothetical protein